MDVNIRELLDHAGIEEKFYPGKRFVKTCAQPGEYKTHCIVLDWRESEKIRIDVKAGHTGLDLKPKDLKHYPVSFQAPTYVEIAIDEMRTAEDIEDEEDGEGSRGKSGSGGGKGHKKKAKRNLNAFADVMKGKIPEAGTVDKLVVMGKEIAKEAYGAVLEKLTEQIKQAKVIATDLLAQAGKFISTVEPPAFMQKKDGVQYDAKYKYDRERNQDIGMLRHRAPKPG